MAISFKITLNNGVKIPQLGLGVYQSPVGKITVNTVRYALKIYGNEIDVGIAVRESRINREEIFITTKLWNSDQGYDKTLSAFENSLQRLGLSYVDLYLIHWPVQGKILETWKAMIKILKEGKARAIGVSNYSIAELKETIQASDIIPAINQVEFHPFLYQKDLLDFCKNNRIQIESYSPLTRGRKLNHPLVKAISNKYGKTTAQILIKWNLQHGLVVIPKSIHENRILENSQVFDFRIEEKDMEALNSLNENLQAIFLD